MKDPDATMPTLEQIAQSIKDLGWKAEKHKDLPECIFCGGSREQYPIDKFACMCYIRAAQNADLVVTRHKIKTSDMCVGTMYDPEAQVEVWDARGTTVEVSVRDRYPYIPEIRIKELSP
jgi:hypothetical protein